MDNQHQKISGYRDLSEAEIDLMNEAKVLEAQVLRFHLKVEDYLLQQRTDDARERMRQDAARATYWHGMSRDDLEKGFMALVRSIAQPQPREY